RVAAGGGERPWIERGHAPVRAVQEELVWRRPDANVRREKVLPAPSVVAVGRKSERNVGDESDLSRRALELAVEVELHPLMKGNSIVEMPACFVYVFRAGMT